MKAIDNVIELQQRKLALLEELKQSMLFDDSDYSIQDVPKMHPSEQQKFILFDKEGKELKFGSSGQIAGYLMMRKIPKEKVYNFNLITT